jgi:hypothetical protein
MSAHIVDGLALLLAAACGFAVAALLAASSQDRRDREARARSRHPAGREVIDLERRYPNVRRIPMTWDEEERRA